MINAYTKSFSRFQIGQEPDGTGISAWYCECCPVPDGAEWLEDSYSESFATCEVCGSEQDDEDEDYYDEDEDEGE